MKLSLTFFFINQIATSLACHQFELPLLSEASVAAVSFSISCFEGDGRPRLCATTVASVLRIWPRGVFGAVGRSQVVRDFLDTQLTVLTAGEVCVAMEEGPCVGVIVHFLSISSFQFLCSSTEVDLLSSIGLLPFFTNLFIPFCPFIFLSMGYRVWVSLVSFGVYLLGVLWIRRAAGSINPC